MYADVFDLKQNLAAGRDARVVQVLQNLVLRVNRDSLPIGQILKVNAVAAACEAQLDSIVNQTPSNFHRATNTHLREQIDQFPCQPIHPRRQR